MRRLFYLVPLAILLVGVLLICRYRQNLGFGVPQMPATTSTGTTSRSEALSWRILDRSSDGFKIEMPADSHQIRVPAYDELGNAESVEMIYAYPDPTISYAVAWATNPPVARINRDNTERTLDMALNGALERSQTELTDQVDISQQGFTGREFSAHNPNGGVINVRLVMTRGRLYMLTVAFPSSSVRRDQDISRFFNSFSVVTTAEP
jgi:hypothetical protein